LKVRANRHSGQAKRDPESRISKQFWILAPAPDPIRGSPDENGQFQTFYEIIKVDYKAIQFCHPQLK
jgi:hypothetical protein